MSDIIVRCYKLLCMLCNRHWHYIQAVFLCSHAVQAVCYNVRYHHCQVEQEELLKMTQVYCYY